MMAKTMSIPKNSSAHPFTIPMMMMIDSGHKVQKPENVANFIMNMLILLACGGLLTTITNDAQ